MREESWIKIVLGFAKEYKVNMILSVMCAIVSVIGGIVPYIAVYQILILFFNNEQNLEKIVFWVLICLLGHIIKVLFYGISTTLSHISTYNILNNMRLEITKKLMKAPLGVVLNENIGKIKNVIIDRVETIELPLAHLIPEGISYSLVPIGVFGYLVFIDYRMALASIITIPISCIIYGFLMKSYNNKYEKYMEYGNYVNGVIVEYIEGIEVIKTFNQSASSYQKYEVAINKFKDYTLNWFKSTWKLMNLASSILPSTLLATMPIGMYLYMNGSITPAELTISLILSLGIVGPLTSFTVFANDIKAIQFAVKDVYEFINLKELTDSKKDVELMEYSVNLSNVSFAYDEGGEKVLNNISVNFKEGTHSAIVGPSGGGKSTIAKLISRFWDVTKGEIKIGGVPIKDIPLSKLSSTISFVAQDNFLFDCSIMENIRLGNPKASDEEVIKAAKDAQCHEFIRKLDKGYNTSAGEAGQKLSGGEKQRIAIARAIIKDTPIVILDEATAFTDPENEYKIQKSLAKLTKGKTLIVIAHRLSTIVNADNIIVLKGGEIVDIGTHEKLIEKCSLYNTMWKSHIGAKNWDARNKRGDLDVFNNKKNNKLV